MAVTPRSARAAAVLLCILQTTTAQGCGNNSHFSSGVCICNSGYACTTCSGVYCTSPPVASDWWGCSSYTEDHMFVSYIPGASSQCVRMSDFCDAPSSQSQSFGSFRSSCRYGSTGKKYLGTISCKNEDGWECDSSTFNRCGSSSSSYTSRYAPECDLDSDTKAALGALIWLIIAAVICCVFVIPIGVCFFFGFACFSAGAAANRNNQQPRFNNPVVNAPGVQAPPQQMGQYPPQPQGPYPPQGGAYPPQPVGGAYPPQQMAAYPPQPQGLYPPQQEKGQYPPVSNA